MFLYDGSSVTNRYLVEAPTKGGAGTRNIWLGGSLVAVVSDGQTWCLMADALESVAAVTNPAGQAIKRNHYKPFGEASAMGARMPAVESQDFTAALGMQHDVLTGLCCAWRRFYDPRIGSFISRDPEVEISGSQIPSGNAPLALLMRRLFPSYLHRNMNPYTYAHNNPTGQTDSTGLQAEPGSYFAAAVTGLGLAALGVAPFPAVLAGAGVLAGMIILENIDVIYEIANNSIENFKSTLCHL